MSIRARTAPARLWAASLPRRHACSSASVAPVRSPLATKSRHPGEAATAAMTAKLRTSPAPVSVGSARCAEALLAPASAPALWPVASRFVWPRHYSTPALKATRRRQRIAKVRSAIPAAAPPVAAGQYRAAATALWWCAIIRRPAPPAARAPPTPRVGVLGPRLGHSPSTSRCTRLRNPRLSAHQPGALSQERQPQRRLGPCAAHPELVPARTCGRSGLSCCDADRAAAHGPVVFKLSLKDARQTEQFPHMVEHARRNAHESDQIVAIGRAVSLVPRRSCRSRAMGPRRGLTSWREIDSSGPTSGVARATAGWRQARP